MGGKLMLCVFRWKLSSCFELMDPLELEYAVQQYYEAEAVAVMDVVMELRFVSVPNGWPVHYALVEWLLPM